MKYPIPMKDLYEVIMKKYDKCMDGPCSKMNTKDESHCKQSLWVYPTQLEEFLGHLYAEGY